jgi:hypothetical protein
VTDIDINDLEIIEGGFLVGCSPPEDIFKPMTPGPTFPPPICF